MVLFFNCFFFIQINIYLSFVYYICKIQDDVVESASQVSGPVSWILHKFFCFCSFLIVFFVVVMKTTATDDTVRGADGS